MKLQQSTRDDGRAMPTIAVAAVLVGTADGMQARYLGQLCCAALFGFQQATLAGLVWSMLPAKFWQHAICEEPWFLFQQHWQFYPYYHALTITTP